MQKLRLLGSLVITLAACGDNTPAMPRTDSGTVDTGSGGPDAFPDGFELLASFDAAMGELPEGVVLVGGVPYVGLAPIGRIVKIPAAGTVETVAQLPTVMETFTLGLAANPAGDIFFGVGAAGANPMPAPGIYRIPAAGGEPTLFASQANMNFPNAMVFRGTDLFVTDSGAGRIFKVATTPAVVVTQWSANAMLQGNMAACGGTGAPFTIGANGIASDANNIYVANTDYGRILRIPVSPAGTAGTPVVVKEDCATLQGADGIVLEADGSIIVVRNGPSNTIVRVSPTGTVTPLHVGGPLEGPASLELDSTNNRLVITNSAFFSTTNPHPSVVAMDL